MGVAPVAASWCQVCCTQLTPQRAPQGIPLVWHQPSLRSWLLTCPSLCAGVPPQICDVGVHPCPSYTTHLQVDSWRVAAQQATDVAEQAQLQLRRLEGALAAAQEEGELVLPGTLLAPASSQQQCLSHGCRHAPLGSCVLTRCHITFLKCRCSAQPPVGKYL
jgi:hypothetical protein